MFTNRPCKTSCHYNALVAFIVNMQGVALRLKPYGCIKFLDVNLNLKPAFVLLPLELVLVKDESWECIFLRFSAKKGPIGPFLGEACQNLPLN